MIPTRGLAAFILIHLVLIAALVLIAERLSALAAAPAPYNRSHWPHWSADGCRDTRTQVLMRDHRDHDEGPTAHRLLWRNGGCEIAFGHWTDPYTGAEIHDPTKLDVDHVIPLKLAYDAGGHRWDRARRQAYANDLKYRWHLLPVVAGENRKKGSQGPDQYRPPRKAFWCQYAQAVSTIAVVWELSLSGPARRAIQEMVETC